MPTNESAVWSTLDKQFDEMAQILRDTLTRAWKLPWSLRPIR
ncbi:hypothetical protein [Amycolatopsis sp. NBC_00438]